MNDFPSFSNNEGIVLLLRADSLIIDEFQYRDDMHFTLLNSFDGVTLERVDYSESTNDLSNWHSASQSSGYGTPAYKNSQHAEHPENTEIVKLNPEVFSPDEDGYKDILYIQYVFTEPGYVANIFAYNAKGKLIKRIVQNELLGTEGIFSWDGTDDYNYKASIGIYIIYFEFFDLKGKVIRKKKVCVIASTP